MQDYIQNMVDHWYYTLAIIVLIITVAIMIYLYGKSKLAKDTIALSKDTIDIMDRHKTAQDEAIKALQEDAKVKTQKISHLSGQVDVLKDIPLRKISESMETLSHSHLELTTYMKAHDETVNAAVDRAVKEVTNHIDEALKNAKV